MNRASRRRTRIRGITGSLLGSGASMVLAMVTSLLVARWLGPQDKGVFTAVLLLPSLLASFCHFGVGSAAIYLINRRPEHRQAIINNNIYFTLVTSSVVVVLLFLTADPLIARYYQSVSDRWLVFAGFLTIPALVVWGQVTSIYHATENYDTYNLTAYVLPQALDLVAVFFGVVLLDAGIRGAVGGLVVSKVLMALALLVHLMWRTGLSGEVSGALLKESLVYGVIRMSGGLMERGSRRGDQALLVALVPASGLGVYSVAATLAELPLLLPKALGTVLYPTISGSEPEQANRYLVRAMRHLAFWILPSSALLLVVSGWGIRVLIGSDFMPAYGLMMLLLPGAALKAVSQPLLAYFAGTGRPGLINWARGISVVVGLGLMFLLLPNYGIVGVAVASSIGYGVNALVLIALWQRVSDTSVTEIFRFTRDDIQVYRELTRRGPA